MIDCPDCGSRVDGLRCRVCGSVGKPKPQVKDVLRDPLMPRVDPVEHWKTVLNTQGLPDISYRYAREALAVIDPEWRRRAEREPGED